MTSKKLSILLAVAAAAPSFVFSAPVFADESLDQYELPKYVVEGKADVYAGGKVVRNSSMGVMGDADYMEVPFNVVSFSRETIEQNKTVGNALTNVLTMDPTVTDNGNNMFNDVKVKGLRINTVSYYLNGLPGLVGASSIPTDFLERVEVVSGPSTMMNGMSYSSSAAGSINLVPKVAGNETKISLTEYFSGQSHMNHALDIGTRFGKNKEWGIRVNANYEDGETAIEHEDIEQKNVFVNMDYNGEKTKAQVLYGHSYTNHMAPQTGIRLHGFELPEAPNGDKNFQIPWGYFEYESDLVTASVEHKLDKNTGVFIKAGYQDFNWECAAINYPRLQTQDGDVKQYVDATKHKEKNTSFSAGIRSEIETGSLNHDLVVSVDTMKHISGFQYGSAEGSGYAEGNIFDGSFEANNMKPLNVNFGKLFTDVYRMESFGIIDRITTDNGKWSFLAGVKRQTVKADEGKVGVTTDYSPNFGIMYSVNDDTKIYANYLESLGKGQFVSKKASLGYKNAGEYLPPQTSEQIEVGIKWDKDKKLGGSFSVFSVDQANAYADSNKVFGYHGRQKNEGAQVTVFGKVAPKWNLMGGVMYLDSKQDGGENDGKHIPGMSDWNATLAAEYQMDDSWSVNSRAVFCSSAPVSFKDNGSRKVPSWWRFDLGANYKHKLANGDGIRAGLTVYNVFDKAYWYGVDRSFEEENVMLGGPRTIALTVSYDF